MGNKIPGRPIDYSPHFSKSVGVWFKIVPSHIDLSRSPSHGISHRTCDDLKPIPI